MAESSYLYRGSLRETPLPEMLSSIDRLRRDGIVEVRSAGILRRAFLRDRTVVYASSSDRAESLGRHLARVGRLGTDQLGRLEEERRFAPKRLGVLLVEASLFTPEEVAGAIREQVEGIAWRLFELSEGEVTFRSGALEEPDAIEIHLPLARFIVQGVARAGEARALAPRLGGRDTVLEPGFRTEDLIALGLDAAQQRVVAAVDGVRTVFDLCSAGALTPAESAKLLYAFKVLELVRPRGAREERPEPIRIRMRTEGDRFAP